MIDLSQLKSQLQNNKGIIVQSLKLLHSSCREHLIGFETALAEGNMPAMSGNAHSLKSKLAYLGHAEGMALAREVEMEAKHAEGITVDMEAKAIRFVSLVQEVIAAVDTEIGKMNWYYYFRKKWLPWNQTETKNWYLS